MPDEPNRRPAASDTLQEGTPGAEPPGKGIGIYDRPARTGLPMRLVWLLVLVALVVIGAFYLL
jgi:hypothetical protein